MERRGNEGRFKLECCHVRLLNETLGSFRLSHTLCTSLVFLCPHCGYFHPRLGLLHRPLMTVLRNLRSANIIFCAPSSHLLSNPKSSISFMPTLHQISSLKPSHIKDISQLNGSLLLGMNDCRTRCETCCVIGVHSYIKKNVSECRASSAQDENLHKCLVAWCNCKVEDRLGFPTAKGRY